MPKADARSPLLGAPRKRTTASKGNLRPIVTGMLIGILGGTPFVIAYISYTRVSTPPTTLDATPEPAPVQQTSPPVPVPVPAQVLAPALPHVLPATSTPLPEPPKPTPSAPPIDDQYHWQYLTKEDAITGQATRTAVLVSETTYELDFPYQGGTGCALRISKHPRNGLTVSVAITKGQLVCHSFSRCRIPVRFDDRPPINFRGVEPADHSNTLIFLEPEKTFLKEIKTSGRVVVELPFFHEGQRVFHFKTADLKWD